MKVPFVVIGGHAVNYHGFIRATEDFDIVFRRTGDSEQALFLALKEIKACWLSNDIDSATGLEKEIPVTLEFVKNTHLMMLTTTMGYLDIFDYIPGFPDVAVQELFDSANNYNGVRIVSLEWLKKLKSNTGRAKDINDIENLP